MSKVKSSKQLESNKKAIEIKLRKALRKYAEISFAYLHGSFVKEDGFKDIDVAVYVKELPPSVLEYELQLETALMEVVDKFTVDVRVLNTSPLSFRYHVIKSGILLVVRNDDERADFQEATLSRYFDFAPYRNLYLRETLGV
jgi:predicted nucleotidyltransferase